jgi:sugar O-acyltransferase (sialic acid O-acetyltransferase NeuD family)
MFKPLIIIGAGGHGKVVLDASIKAGFSVDGFLDDARGKSGFFGVKQIGAVSDYRKYNKTHVFICAIGDNNTRQKIVESVDVEWTKIIHPSVQIGIDAKIKPGTVVFAGAVVNASAIIGCHCIVNTAVIVEHDCMISDFVHLSPNATICGNVCVGSNSWVGAGATITNDVSISSDVTIGCGAVVVKSINERGTYVGVPAKLQV